MKLSGYEEVDKFEQEVRRWLEKREISIHNYETLPIQDKIVLRNLVCNPTQPTTDRQRRELYRKLCLSSIAGRESIDPTDFMPEKELNKFFSPLSPGEKLNYFEKF